MNIIISAILSYLAGSISGSMVLGKFKGVDILFEIPGLGTKKLVTINLGADNAEYYFFDPRNFFKKN